ncbi:hypothetical protein BU14_0364s0011 [Porphyra umbilicalis]|uniref:Uncharacterized protein n=1 Tax=Porphyra umbilicalis TaxID=2786 RepID=A0A1X6NXF5_PORUM|nr:hypothetical protein BU14_0364s0011 [Porphyra umbilicalis]|eukprot:OSX73257.1 hypothetical protein BU14_0364s0011 [Porphyra umbilicalis]
MSARANTSTSMESHPPSTSNTGSASIAEMKVRTVIQRSLSTSGSSVGGKKSVQMHKISVAAGAAAAAGCGSVDCCGLVNGGTPVDGGGSVDGDDSAEGGGSVGGSDSACSKSSVCSEYSVCNSSTAGTSSAVRSGSISHDMADPSDGWLSIALDGSAAMCDSNASVGVWSSSGSAASAGSPATSDSGVVPPTASCTTALRTALTAMSRRPESCASASSGATAAAAPARARAAAPPSPPAMAEQ